MSTATQIKYYLVLYGRVVSFVAIAAAIAAFGAAGYVYTNPPIEQTSPEETNVQSFSFNTDHRATVTGPTQLYNQGRTLRNHPVYFRNVSPDITFATTVSVPENRQVNITHRIVVNYAATFRGEVFWTRQEVLAAEQWTVRDGQVQTNTTLTVEDYLSRITPFEEAVGSTGTLSRELEFMISYDSPTGDGSAYNGELRSTATIQSSPDAYWISSDIGSSTTKSQTRPPEQFRGEPDMQRVQLLGGSGSLLFFSGLVIFIWARRQGSPTELELAVVRDRYDEWISQGEFPTGVASEYIFINSIEDLVDIAIDTNKRVIHDSNLDTYSVVDDQIVYYYATDPTSISSWLNISGEE